jgi:aminobutyraldehyde dehydrogenase
VGARLTSHPDVRMSSLTGSVETGRTLMRASADSNLKRLHLELGGKAPVLVFDDANIDLTVEKVMEGAFCNSGQDCMAAARIYAHESVHDELVNGLRKAVEGLDLGDLSSEDTDMGPVITAAHRDKVEGFVRRAQDSGHVELIQGSNPGVGFYTAPTVVVGAEQGDEIVSQEVFGPVTSVTRFTDRDDVVAWANSSSAPSGSTTTCPSPRRCPTAASSSPATARTCRSTPSRSTPRSSTSWSTRRPPDERGLRRQHLPTPEGCVPGALRGVLA